MNYLDRTLYAMQDFHGKWDAAEQVQSVDGALVELPSVLSQDPESDRMSLSL
jgi:hypothetical protein